MSKTKKNWLYRALCAALAVTLVSGMAVMSPVADIVGTNITANAAYEGYTTWTGTGTDENGNSATVTCYWKIDNGKLYIAGNIPNLSDYRDAPWYNNSRVTSVYVEEGARTSASPRYLFRDLYNATSIDVSNLDTSNAVNMYSMFSGCKALTSLDLSSWDISKVEDLGWFLEECNSLESLNLDGWDISSVTTTAGMFAKCKKLTSLDLSGWDTSKVRNMSSMFQSCSSLTLLDLRGWNTSEIWTTAYMFSYCTSLTSLDLSAFDTSKVTNMYMTFSNCTNLETVYVGDGWNTNIVDNSNYMFRNCTNIVGGNGTTYDSSKLDKTYACIDGKDGQPGYFTQGPAHAKTYTITWKNYDGTTLETDENVEEGETPTYDGATPEKTATAQYTYTFSGWTPEISAVTGDVTYTAQFTETTNTYTVTWQNEDGTVLETDTDVAYGTTPTYDGTAPTKEGNERYTYTFSGWGTVSAVTGNVTYTAQFTVTDRYEGYTEWTGKGTDANGNSATVTCYWKIDNGKLYIAGNIPNTYGNNDSSKIPWYTYRKNITEVTTEKGAKTSAEASRLFADLENATSMDLSNLDTSDATQMFRMFANCKALTTLDLRGWDTSNVTDMERMFNECRHLTSLNLSGWNTSSVTDMDSIFYYCDSLTSLDMSGWDTKNVTDMCNMFGSCKALTSLDVSGWNTSSVTTMGKMFYHCESLTPLDVSSWDTKNVKNMLMMFAYCKAFTSLDLSSWDTGNVTSTSCMFYGCQNLATLDLSGWNTSKVSNMSYMFNECGNLVTVYVGSKWNTDNVTSNNSTSMFADCSTKLVGGNGTAWNSSNPKDKTYARIDGGESNPGYFTAKAAPTYTVTWLNDDGTELGTTSAETGTSPVYSGATPTKEGNAQYSYTFKGWTSDGGTTVYAPEELPAGTQDVTYTAVFESTVNTYTVTWKNDDGTILETDTDVAYGTEPTYDGAAPTKASTTEYSYTFSGWTPEITAVTGDTTYTAQFTETTNTYTVTWIDGDGNTLTTDTVAYGETPVYSGATPTKTATAQYSYTFSGWDNEPTAVTGDVTYTAQFTENIKTYTVTFDSNGGTIVDSQDIEWNKTATVPDEPSKVYCTFDGWYLGDTPYDFDTPVTSDITLTAHWIEKDATETIVTDSISLQTALNNGGTVKLGASITTDAAITVDNCTCTLDLNGYDLTYNGEENYFFTLNNANMTIEGNGKFTSTSKSGILATNSDLTVNGGNFEAYYTNFNLTDNSTVEINGGYFISTSGDVSLSDDGSTAEIKGGFFKSNPDTYLADGYISEYLNNGSMYLVYKEGSKVGGGTFWAVIDETPDNGDENDCILYLFGTMTGFDGWSSKVPWIVSPYREKIKKVLALPGATAIGDLAWFFYACNNITEIDVSNLDTSGATGMSRMFSWCESLEKLTLGGKFVTSNVTNMTYMFQGATKLEVLDLKDWDVSKVKNMFYMFDQASALTSLNLSGWDTSSVTNMTYMFSNCSSLTSLNLSGWDTSSVTDMSWMFGGASSLTSLDLSSWNTSNVTNMSCMFYNCPALTTIYVGSDWDTSRVSSSNSNHMFTGCTSLVGGQGTSYNADKRDKTYAHIDGGTSNPGYFTQGTATSKTYTVTWQNYDGTTLETDEDVEEGTMPEYNGTTPARTATAQYSYTFSGWDKEITAVTGDVTYTAQFTETTNTYTVTWQNEDGTVIDTTTVAYGDTPTHAAPTKEGNAQYTYTFSGWTPEITAVTGDVTYTAQFTETTNTYTVTWRNEDGTVLETDTDVAYGTTPSYDGAAPTKESTTEYRYIFSGWTPDVDTVTGDVAYTAVFTEERHFIDDTHHAWYTFDKERGHMEIYGDGQAFKKQYAFGTFTSSKPNTEVISVHLNNDNGEINTKDFTGWFQSFTALKEVTGKFPAVVERMGSTFYNCKSLTYVEFVPEVTVAATKMFSSCTKLSSIGNADNTIKISCTSYQGVFQGCYVLNANVVFNKSLNAANIERGYYENAFENAAVWGGNIVVCMTSNVNDKTVELIKSTVVNNTSSAKQNISYHHYSDYIDNGDGTHSHTCDVCGESETENHTFDNGICTVCGSKEDYTITITNGIVAKGEKEIYHVGDIVTLKADEPEEGKVFAYWQDGNGNKLSTKANYSFVVLKNVDLTAVYENEYVAESILDISAVQTSSNGKNAIRFVFTRSVDTTAEVKEVGLIYATNKLAGYTDGAKVNLSEESDFDIETALKGNTSGKVKTYKGTSTSINGTIRLTYTIGNNTDCYVYAYGYVKLTDGTTLYTDLLATTYDSIV